MCFHASLLILRSIFLRTTINILNLYILDENYYRDLKKTLIHFINFLVALVSCLEVTMRIVHHLVKCV